MGRERRRSQHWRSATAAVLVLVGSLSLTVALAAGWTRRTVFDSHEFAERAASVLDSSTVRHALAERISDQLIENGSSSLASYRTVLVGVVDNVLSTRGFRSIFIGAVEQAHDAAFQRNGTVALLQLGETLKLLSSNAESVNRSLAASLPSNAGSLLINVTPTLERFRPWRFAIDTRRLDEACLSATILAFVGAFAIDRRRRVLMMTGFGVAGAGFVLALTAYAIPRIAATTIRSPSESSAIAAAVGRFVSQLRAVGLWSLLFGIVVVAAADPGERLYRLPFDEWLRATRRGARGERGRAVQLGVGISVVACGLAILILRRRIVPIAVLGAGATVVYLGGVVATRAMVGPEPEPATASRARPANRLLAGSAAAIIAVVLAAVLVVNVATTRSQARTRGALLCNGSADLCDRRLDQVAFAGSHNSMSAEADPGWLFAENSHGIAAQLQYGIRAFLVKTHYGIDTRIHVAGAPVVVTDRTAEIAHDPDAEAAELGEDAVKTVQRIDRQVGHVSGRPDIYLCHGYCELGATKFSLALDAIRQFMNRNPDDVLIMVIGDYVTPSDTEAAFRRAGLINRLWTYDPDKQPPTLREMIDARRTLMVFAENDGGSPSWYGRAYGETGTFQDTPYTFANASEFSCAPNRGPADAPLFQINHWITNTSPPSPTLARSINSYPTLLARVKECEHERKRFPTIVGVNFYDDGALLKVVDKLNQ